MKMSQLRPRCLGLEILEHRKLLAVSVIEHPVPIQDFLPGGSGIVAGVDISSTSAVRLKELIAVPVTGTRLTGTLSSVALRADLDGRPGYETPVPAAMTIRPDGALVLDCYDPVWISGSRPLKLALVGTVTVYPSYNCVGLDVVQAEFFGIDGKPLPDSAVSYSGKTTLHGVENNVLSVYQQFGDKYGSALSGQKDVDLMDFYVWGYNSAKLKTFSVDAAQGSLSNAKNYSLWVDTNFDGMADKRVASGLMKTSRGHSEVFFQLGTSAPDNGAYQVHADIADRLAADPHLRLGFSTDPRDLTGISPMTGKRLHGLAVNNVGPGQIRLTTNVGILFTFAANPELVVKEIPATSPTYRFVNPGTANVVLEAFTIFDSASDVTITHVGVVAAQGDLFAFTHYVMWWDSNGDGVVDSSANGKLVVEGTTLEVSFDASVPVSASHSTLFEVHADARSDIQYGYLRTQLAGDLAVKANHPDGRQLATSQIFKEYGRQTDWYVGTGGGMG